MRRDESHNKEQHSAKFRALVVPVFIAVIISVSAFVAMVIIAVVEQDKIALENEQKVLFHATRRIEKNLQALALDSAWWDVAVEKLYVTEDPDWADLTIGDTASKIPLVDGVIILRADGTILYEHVFDGDIRAEAIADQLAPLTRTLSLKDDSKNADSAGYVGILGRPVAFGVSMVRRNGITAAHTPLPERMPMIIFFGSMTQPRLRDIARENGIEDASINYTGVPADASLVLTDYKNQPVATIRWRTAAPGSKLADRLMLPLIPALGLIIAALVYFITQAMRLIHELDSANRSKSSFLASMSHEIRTPLNSILGFTELVSLEMFGKVEGQKNKEYLSLIRGSGEHLLAIINDILDLSKLEAGRYDVHAELINPEEVIRECVKLVETTANEKKIELKVKLETATLQSDERILRQILLNILSNALKFTANAGLIEIRTTRQQDFYAIDVKDNGIGMTEAQIAIAMAPFGQVENEYARKHTGTGLGLPLVNRFIHLLDGRMHVSSRPGYGTTVSLIIPYKTKPKHL